MTPPSAEYLGRAGCLTADDTDFPDTRDGGCAPGTGRVLTLWPGGGCTQLSPKSVASVTSVVSRTAGSGFLVPLIPLSAVCPPRQWLSASEGLIWFKEASYWWRGGISAVTPTKNGAEPEMVDSKSTLSTGLSGCGLSQVWT